MIQIGGEEFVSEEVASATINTLLEMKFAFDRAKFKNLSLPERAQLYKAAKRRWTKTHAAPSNSG